jgi:hypothetical protein
MAILLAVMIKDPAAAADAPDASRLAHVASLDWGVHLLEHLLIGYPLCFLAARMTERSCWSSLS